MDILKNLSDAEVRALANSETPRPMAGTWVLTAPDGRAWTGDSPMQCVQAETRSRIPAQVALARIRQSLMDAAAEDDAADGEQKDDTSQKRFTHEELLAKFDPRSRVA